MDANELLATLTAIYDAAAAEKQRVTARYEGQSGDAVTAWKGEMETIDRAMSRQLVDEVVRFIERRQRGE
jgi:hypothetical protein